jgi:hypothetical protein
MDELDWSGVPDGYTHWDCGSDVWCNEFGFMIYGGRYEVFSHDDWGDTDRYIPRPASPTDIPKGVYHLGNMRQDVPTPTTHKYHRQIIGLCGTAVQVDVDRVLESYKPAYPQLAHAAKKALCAGTRGHKSLRQDILDIIESAQNALVLHDQMEALK